jgi:flagellar protein FlbD
MIYVTRLNHTPVVLNCDLIEHMETTPDTVISLTTGQKFMVLESAEEIVAQVVNYRRLILQGLPQCRPASDSTGDGAPDQLGNGTYGRR